MEPYGLPIGDVLGDEFQVPALPSGWTALDGLVLVKCLDQDGHSTWAFRETNGINEEEIIGALTLQLDIMRERAVDQYRPTDE